jgi:hypothetical protein
MGMVTPNVAQRRLREGGEHAGAVSFAKVHRYISANWAVAEPIAAKRLPMETATTDLFTAE